MKDKNNLQDNLKLQQTVRFFEALLRASADGIVITDSSKNIIFVNDTFCKIFGCFRQDVIETNLFLWLEKLNPNARDIWIGLESQVNEHGIAMDVEFEMKSEEGMRYFSVNSSYLEKIDIEETGLIISILRDITERKIAQKALQQAHDELEMQVEERTEQLSNLNISLDESRQFIESIVNLSPDILYIYDLIEQKNVYSNDGIQKILNYSAKEVQEMGSNLLPNLMHPDDFKIYLEETYPRYSKFKDNEPIIHEYRMKDKNGQWHWLDCKEIIYSRQQNGSPRQIFGVVHDITNRKKAEEAIRESEEKYRMLFEYSNDIIVHVDRYGKVLTVNNKLEEMLGFKPDDVIGKYFFNLGVLKLRDLPQIIQLFKNTVRKGMNRDKKGKLLEKVEIELRDKNGNFIFVETSTTVLKNDGKVEGFLTNIRDISESKKAKEQLKASEAKYSTLVEKGNDGIIILQDDLLKYVNSKICEMTGYTREEIIGKPFLTYASEEYKKLVRERYEKRLKGDSTPNVYEIEIVSKNGLKMPFEINASRIDYEGRPASMAILRDISKRKQAETILRIQKDIASSLSVPGDMDIMLDQILKAVSCIDGIDSGGIYISDRLTGDLILKAHYGFSSEFVRGVKTFAYDTPQWRLVQAGQPRYLKYSEDFKKRPYLLTEGLRGVAVIPVVQDGRVISSLNMGSHTLDDIPVHTRIILETIAGQIREVIARIKSEEELKDTKNYLDKVIKSSYDSIFVVDDEGKFEFGNEAFFNISGYPQSEILGQSFMKIIHPDYHEFILKRWDEVQRGEGRPYEVDIIQKDGTVKSLSVSHTDMELGGKRKYCVIAKDMTERNRAEEALRSSLEEKTVLLHEVHHRVKNNLQIVSSLLNLQAMRIKNKEAIEALREMGNRIQSMALLHETLNISGNLSRVNFTTYIKNICVHILRSYGSKAENIKLENKIADTFIDLDLAVPCGLIVNELVSNALKHAFPEGQKGRITVELQALPDGQIRLTVADDGIGLPPGLDISQTETLGLKLVTILTEKLKGSVEIIRDPGTTFHIMFKGKRNEKSEEE